MTLALIYIDLGLAICLWAMQCGDGLEMMEDSKRRALRDRGVSATQLERSWPAIRWLVVLMLVAIWPLLFALEVAELAVRRLR